MGVVYEAFDRETRMRIALKTIRSLNPDAVLRFKREFRALRDLQHPHLVRLGELIEEQGQWFFTMELLDGVDFLTYVRPLETGPDGPGPTTAPSAGSSAETRPLSLASPRGITSRAVGGALDEVRLRSALAQLIEVLVDLHQSSKVHRDIKPSNVLVTSDHRVVLLDFGLVADLGHDSATSAVVGTVDYMAPEQAKSHQASAAADWYSVGVVLYEALTGRLPFSGTIFEIVLKKENELPAPPCSVAPDVPPDLSDLCLELLQLDPESRPRGPNLLMRFGRSREIALSGSSLPQLHRRGSPFVGREDELAVLRCAFEDCRESRAVTLLISGESGLGKSCLLERFTDRLHAEVPRLVVLSGRCHEREAVPYKALDGVVDGLAQFIARLPDAEAAALLPRRIDLLANVFPVLHRIRVVGQAPRLRGTILDPQELRMHVFAAFVELLSRLCARYPVVVAIDDFQWADVDSRALLAEVMRPPDAPALLLIVAARASPEEKAGAAALLPGDVRTLALRGLPEAQASQLAALLMGSLAPASRVSPEAIAREAGGHPLFIEELVHHLQTLGEKDHGPMPLERALWSRICRLDEAARLIMELSAVAGVPVGQQVIAQAAELDFPDFVEPVSILEAGHLIRRSGARLADTLEPYHDRVRDAVLANLAPETRRVRHERLAIALEAAERTDAEMLAVHWREAGRPDRAIQYAIRAAEEAATALAFDREVRLYRLSLELVPDRDAVKRQSLTVSLGDALANAGRGTDAAGAYLAAAAEADPVAALDLRCRAAEQLLRSGRLDEGIAVFSMVARAVGKKVAKTPRRALASVVLGRMRLRLRGLSLRARSRDELTAEQSLHMDIWWGASVGLALTDSIRGAAFIVQYLLLALELGQESALARALSLHAVAVAAEGGRVARPAAKVLKRARDLAARLDDPHTTSWTLGSQGGVAFFQGRWKEVVGPVDVAERMLRERCSGVGWERGTALVLRIAALAWLGELDEMVRRVPMYLQEAEDRGDLYTAVNMCTGPSILAWLARDDAAGARQVATQARQRWTQQGFHVQHANELYAQTLVDLYTGDGPTAYARVTAAWRPLRGSYLLLCQLNRINMFHIRARAALAALAAPGADRKALVRVATRDAKRIARERMPWSNALAQLLFAGLAATHGRTDRAIAFLQAAAVQSDAADMALHAAVARRLQGMLMGGAEGRDLISSAEAWMRSQRIQNPDRMVAMLAPGFAR